MTCISLTFRTKALLNESDDLAFLDTPHHSFPSQHHRDKKSVCYIKLTRNGRYNRTVRVNQLTKPSASRAIISELPSHQNTLTSSRSINRESRILNINRQFCTSVYTQNILWNKYLWLNFLLLSIPIVEYSFRTYHDIPPHLHRCFHFLYQ